MSFLDISQWSCCKELTEEKRSETSQYHQFKRPEVTRGVQPVWKKNNFENGTRNWAFMEIKIEDLRHCLLNSYIHFLPRSLSDGPGVSCLVVCRKCMLIISADETGQILETTKKFDKVNLSSHPRFKKSFSKGQNKA